MTIYLLINNWQRKIYVECIIYHKIFFIHKHLFLYERQLMFSNHLRLTCKNILKLWRIRFKYIFKIWGKIMYHHFKLKMFSRNWLLSNWICFLDLRNCFSEMTYWKAIKFTLIFIFEINLRNHKKMYEVFHKQKFCWNCDFIIFYTLIILLLYQIHEIFLRSRNCAY